MKKRLPGFYKQKKSSSQSGFILITSIIILVVVTVLISIIFSLVLLSLRKADSNKRTISVLDISEAGINYYLWHLSHAPADYCDGNTCTAGQAVYGPYTHNYTNSNGDTIGSYTLWIAPPGVGSQGGKVTLCHVTSSTPNTISVAPSAVAAHLGHGDYLGPCGGSVVTNTGTNVTIESKGVILGGNENRTIVAELGIPSFANYSVVANDTVNDLRIGEGTETYGPVHNNGGVHFDGVAHAIVTSSVASYTDPDTGLNAAGVYTTEPNANQVFLAGRQFPVPPVDFSAITTNLSDLKSKAQSSGIYYGASGGSGYHIVLKTNDTFDIYRVTGVGGTCGTSSSPKENITSQVLLANRSFPSNGVVFLADKLWIDGQINGAQLTFVAALIGATAAQEKSVVINNDLLYTNYDGTDKIGIVAQKDISAGLNSEGAFSGSSDAQELRIDGALLAQDGRVGRSYYSSSCGTGYTRNILTLYGSIGTNQRYGFSYTDGTGYATRNLYYDPYLSLIPPPFFPTTGSYTILSWKEK